MTDEVTSSSSSLLSTAHNNVSKSNALQETEEDDNGSPVKLESFQKCFGIQVNSCSTEDDYVEGSSSSSSSGSNTYSELKVIDDRIRSIENTSESTTESVVSPFSTSFPADSTASEIFKPGRMKKKRGESF